MNLEIELMKKHYHQGDSLTPIIDIKDAAVIGKKYTEGMCKQARVDELDKAMNVKNLVKWQDYYDKRIKELNAPLATEEK